MLFKILLGRAVEGKCSYGALQMRSGDAPSTMGTAPSSEVIAVDPDQVFVHEYTFAYLCLQLSSGHWIGFASIAEPRIPLSRRVFSTDSPASQVTKGLRPRGQRPEDAERVGG